MKFAAQILVVIHVVGAFLYNVSTDFEGRKAKEPEGFKGFIVSLIVITFMVFVFWKAGAFTELLP